MPGHPPGDGVDDELDLGAVGLQRSGELLDRVLGLGDRHAVAGDEDDLLGGLEHEEGLVGREDLGLALLAVPPPPPPGSAAPKPEKRTLGSERFIALHMMRVRMSPEAPTRAPVMMSRTLLTAKPAAQAARPE